ncbi:hypothetical protein PO587_27260 [Streptomyces gilvifuscus]|uniref:Uncharacterized protein n=1 Tax=Streptomyces gilvifuscus TaxID=1550617 RepID=A0ABT5G0A0_9ACTN|nr:MULTISPECIES: hypothetical protein [Streptomyces]MDC2958150.1 hypothetical protein [Streptomyces gilvifuscus]
MAVVLLIALAVLLPTVCFGTALLIERAEERKKEHRQRVRLVNEAIQLDIAARSRKHTTMRQMRDVARDYRRP